MLDLSGPPPFSASANERRAFDLRAAKLLHLSNLTPSAGIRTRQGAFLSHGDWDAPALVEAIATTLLKQMKLTAGEVIELILDDTRVAKRGRKMDNVSKIWDQQKFIRGHIVLAAAARPTVLQNHRPRPAMTRAAQPNSATMPQVEAGSGTTTNETVVEATPRGCGS